MSAHFVIAGLVWLSVVVSCGPRSGNAHEPLDTAHAPRKPRGPSEAGATDAGGDSGVFDAAVDPLTRECPLTGAHVEATTSGTGTQVFALDVSVNTAHLLYATGGCASDASLLGSSMHDIAVPSSGAPDDPFEFENEACVEHRDLALGATPNKTWAYFVRGGAHGDQVVAVDLTKGPSSETTVLLEQAGHTSNAIAAGSIGGHGILAWAHSAGSDAPSEISLFFDGLASSRRVALSTSAGQHVAALAIGSLGHDAPAKGLHVLAWVDTTQGSGAIRLQILDDQGSPAAEAVSLSTSVGPLNRVDFVGQESGGALVFTEGAGERQRTLFVPIESTGTLAREPVVITNSDQNALDASIAEYAAGYAIVYRFVPTDPQGEPRIRAAFVDSVGNIAGTRDIAPALAGPGPIRTVLAADGRLFVGWLDHEASGAVVRLVRVLCE